MHSLAHPLRKSRQQNAKFHALCEIVGAGQLIFHFEDDFSGTAASLRVCDGIFRFAD